MKRLYKKTKTKSTKFYAFKGTTKSTYRSVWINLTK